ncbi:MAG: hypothetical protein RBS99_12295, partial [Rhodospirillales bacterium]|nr:hypothetical protein [Rhodospirillales bacterium]
REPVVDSSIGSPENGTRGDCREQRIGGDLGAWTGPKGGAYLECGKSWKVYHPKMEKHPLFCQQNI